MKEFLGGFGVLSAPNVQIGLKEKNKQRENDISQILDKVKVINQSAKQKGDIQKGIRNLISFKKGGEEKCVLILKSKSEGFSINMSWVGDVFVWTKETDKGIEFYFLNSEDYESLKAQKEGEMHPRGTIDKTWKVSVEEFEHFFCEEENPE